MESEFIILGKINISSLLKAQKAFVRALGEAETELERDGTIQRFEFTYELLWKTLRRILAFKGVTINSPRDVFREAAKQKLIDDPLVWFEFIKKRNLTVHTYNEDCANQDCANEIFESLPLFEKELNKLVVLIKKL